MTLSQMNYMTCNDKLIQARCRLLAKIPVYGHIAMNMIWKRNDFAWLPEDERTMGVRIVDGVVECLYYCPFVDSLSLKELYVVIQHEIEHIVRCHCIRALSKDQYYWNIACDMCVNGKKSSPRIGYLDTNNTLIIPHADRIHWIPEDWEDNKTAEEYYELLLNGHDCSGHTLDAHSIWSQSNASDDEARQIINDLVEQAIEKSIGDIPGHMNTFLKSLSKPIIAWHRLLNRYVGRIIGCDDRHTYNRRNRRYDLFGLPGVSNRNSISINIIVDTSGSVFMHEYEAFFGIIDKLSNRFDVHVLQWDGAYQGYHKYRKGDWKKFKIAGFGGTKMCESFKWLKENKLLRKLQIMLTDGHTEWVDSVDFDIITVITSSDSPTGDPKYGYVVKMLM